MSPDVLKGPEGLAEAAARMAEARVFNGLPNQFWPLLIEAQARLVNAVAATLMNRAGDAEASGWRRLLFWSSAELTSSRRDSFLNGSEAACEACLSGNGAWTQPPAESSGGSPNGDQLMAVRLHTGNDRDTVVAVFLRAGGPEGLSEALLRLQLVADAPSSYQTRRVVEQARTDVEQFSSVLDLMALLNGERKFVAAAMTFCNEIASRHRCGRVSLGWLDRGYVRVQAVSHMEKFEKKMGAVRSLERVMEEALDQDEELLWPPPAESTAIVRDHEAYAREQAIAHVCSLPLRLDGKAAGVLTCERADPAFSELELRHLRLYCDQAARRLGDLKGQSRWFGARWLEAARDSLQRWVGPEHTLAKAVAVIGVMAVAFLLFGRIEYRVKAPFVLRCEEIRHLPAPFDGYVSVVNSEKGQPVKAGDTLLQMDNRELLLEAEAALADQSRYQREAEKARAQRQNALAEMRIAEAEAEQARTRLEKARYRLERAAIQAPFDGIVVEGDWKDRVGSPVRQGELIFKVARIDRMYAEVAVREEDVHGVRNAAAGSVAFASQPALRFPVRAERVEPSAVTRPDGNVFLVRCTFDTAGAGWWRPGMSGMARISAGRRSPLWIISHRTVDYLRLRFG